MAKHQYTHHIAKEEKLSKHRELTFAITSEIVSLYQWAQTLNLKFLVHETPHLHIKIEVFKINKNKNCSESIQNWGAKREQKLFVGRRSSQSMLFFL